MCETTSPKEIFEQTFEINRRLADVALNGGGLRAIAQKLSDALGTPVIIEDAGWERITVRMPYRITSIISCETLVQQLTGAFVSYYKRAGFLNELIKGRRVIWEGIPQKGVKARVIAPIFVDKELQGYISVLSLEGLPNELQIMACEQAAIVAALEISKERAVEQTRFRMERDVLQEVVSNSLESPQLVMKQLSMLGWDLDRTVVVLSFELDSLENTMFSGSALEPEKLDTLKQNIVRRVKTVVMQTDAKAVVSFLSDSDLTVIANPATEAVPDKEDIQRFISEIRRVLDELVPDVEVRIGVGGISRKVDDIAKSYSQARQALRVGAVMMSKEEVHFYEDLGLYKLLFELADTKELQEFCLENIAPLLEYDRKNKADFLRTLERYLETNGSVRETAEDLFIHRNTLNYRLRRIEEILGQDLSDSETRLKLLLALRIRRITQAKGGALGVE
ncbi:MAG: helix-turn-helix domain-containing protein [Firmicutes bacterium]|nr:helix-turn-helix domain-containing protein [Bacillota bacterium]